MRALPLLAGLAVTATAPSVLAQESEWRLMPYAWIAGLDGTIGVDDSGGGGSLEGSFGQLADNLELGGAMLCAEWRRGPWSVFGDWTHVRVRSEADSPFGAYVGGITAEVAGNVVQMALGRELHRTGAHGLDAFAGFRVYDLDATVSLLPASAAGQTSAVEDGWFDGVVGMRWRAQLGEHWDVGAYGDVGGGGSDLSWQLMLSAGFRFSWGSIVGGWRHLDIDYADGPLQFDAALTGPFLGVSFRF
jgi:hypothetical protein